MGYSESDLKMMQDRIKNGAKKAKVSNQTVVIPVKPLSVNDCWKGRRFKTKDYSTYEGIVLSLLPDMELPEAPYHVQIEVGFSSAGGDIDNPIKPILDILQKKYGFNDNKIVRLEVIRRIVKKDEEFFSFKINKVNVA